MPGCLANLTQSRDRADLVVRGLECESMRKMLRSIDAAEGGRSQGKEKPLVAWFAQVLLGEDSGDFRENA